MRKRLIFAIIFYVTGTLNIIDWYVFWYQNEDLALKSFNVLKVKYIERFPSLLRPLFELNPQPAAIVFILLFLYSAIIFLNEKNLIFKIMGVTSILFLLQNTFSIM
jgi:hypothetical protein